MHMLRVVSVSINSLYLREDEEEEEANDKEEVPSICHLGRLLSFYLDSSRSQ